MNTVINYAEYIKDVDKNDLNNDVVNLTSSEDMKKYLGDDIEKKIIIYTDFKKYKNINELLTYDGDYRIILWRQSENSGHWTLLLRYGDVIEHFDSYAKQPYYSLNYSKGKNIFLDQKKIYYQRLLKNASFKVIYNGFRFQSEKINIATCGRHLLLRLIYFKHYNYDLNKYIDKFQRLKKKYKGLTNDQIVTLLIPITDDDVNIIFN